MFQSTLQVNLSKVLENIGLFCPYFMNSSNFEYIVTLLASKDVLTARTNQAMAEYLLENLQLEDVSNKITTNFSIDKSIPHEHVTMFQKLSWPKATTL